MEVWIIIIALYSNSSGVSGVLRDTQMREYIGEERRCVQLMEMYKKGFERLKGVYVVGYCHRKK